jgi:prefoldin subunit 5
VDIAPDRAEVWVNGEYLGVADDFDGFPSYLWLAPGTYDVVFYLPGYRTLARQYTIRPGQVLDVEDHLEPGESIHPRDLASTSTERRTERLRRREERYQEVLRNLEEELGELRRKIEASEQRSKALTGPDPSENSENSPEAEPERSAAQELEQEVEALKEQLQEVQEALRETATSEIEIAERKSEPESPHSAQREAAHAGSARLRLRVEPGDASVYLDGRFLGSAAELSRLRDGLLIAGGEHVLEVVRPGWQEEVERFEAKEGSEITLEVSLRRK